MKRSPRVSAGVKRFKTTSNTVNLQRIRKENKSHVRVRFIYINYFLSSRTWAACVLTRQSSLLFAFQSGTRVKNVYASLANGTLVVFTPKTVSTARRCSHNDVTLVTKEDDEQVTTESDKWSNLQVCGISFNVESPFLTWRVMKISPQLFQVC